MEPDAQRLSLTRTLFSSHGFDGAVVRSPGLIRMFTGWYPRVPGALAVLLQNGLCLVAAPAGSEPTPDETWATEILPIFADTDDPLGQPSPVPVLRQIFGGMVRQDIIISERTAPPHAAALGDGPDAAWEETLRASGGCTFADGWDTFSALAIWLSDREAADLRAAGLAVRAGLGAASASTDREMSLVAAAASAAAFAAGAQTLQIDARADDTSKRGVGGERSISKPGLLRVACEINGLWAMAARSLPADGDSESDGLDAAATAAQGAGIAAIRLGVYAGEVRRAAAAAMGEVHPAPWFGHGIGMLPPSRRLRPGFRPDSIDPVRTPSAFVFGPVYKAGGVWRARQDTLVFTGRGVENLTG